jgi:hypothetical protein
MSLNKIFCRSAITFGEIQWRGLAVLKADGYMWNKLYLQDTLLHVKIRKKKEELKNYLRNTRPLILHILRYYYLCQDM